MHPDYDYEPWLLQQRNSDFRPALLNDSFRERSWGNSREKAWGIVAASAAYFLIAFEQGMHGFENVRIHEKIVASLLIQFLNQYAEKKW